ncbi:hypothetical protein N3K66_003906 [Trichothecium roseum]|uniref:Uncharacterized protein n=1 Tax=Trichothecium roseum TaxID=47278 RepID=A0ACC0V8P3_9HYPO|nr:hypothetical protein N3K66_003906 [Trichothecium roseum]
MASLTQRATAWLRLEGPSREASPMVIAAAVASSLIFAVYQWLLPRPIPGIPYNPEAARRILGDIPSMLRDERGAMDWLLAQSQRHSGPVCQLFLRPFGRPFVLLSDFREAQDIMMRRKEWDRSDYSIEIFSGQAPEHHINKKTGPAWKSHRRLLQDLMMPTFLKGVAAPNIYASTMNLVELWTTKAKLACGRPFDADKDIFHASLDAVLEFSFGASYPHRAVAPQIHHIRSMSADEIANRIDTKTGAVKFDSAQLHETIDATLHASDVFGDLVDSPWPAITWWFKSKTPWERRYIRVRNTFVMEQIAKAVGRLEAEANVRDVSWVKSAADLMMQRERLFANKEQREPAYFSAAMRDEVIGFVVAGHDTTSTTALWGLKFLADAPDVQTKLRKALEAAHVEALSEERLPNAQDIARSTIPYLEAVIEEILRLANTLPVLDRQTDRDTELLGYHIPKDTILMLLNRGPSFTEPGFDIDEETRSPSCRMAKTKRGLREWNIAGMEVFQPERWIKDEGGKEIFDSIAGPALPFGLGTRGCFGRKLAYLELRIILTLLLWRFRLHKCPEDLSGYRAVETLTHKPKQCYVQLEEIER